MAAQARKFFLDFGMKAAGEADGGVYVEGYASTYDQDRDGERVGGKTAFQDGWREYVANPVVLFAHDHKQPIGTVVEHKFDDRGLWVKAYISSGTPHIVQLIKDGALRAFSIGGLMSVAKGVIEKIKLFEISVVSVPANPTALFEVATKAFQLDTSSAAGTGPGEKAVLSAKHEGLLRDALASLQAVLDNDEKGKSAYYGVTVTSDPLSPDGQPVAGYGDAYVSAADLESLTDVLRDLNRQIDQALVSLSGGEGDGGATEAA